MKQSDLEDKKPSSFLRMAYLIPEYPSQSHIWFWREKEALIKKGVEITVFSTRRPPKTEQIHVFAAEEQNHTEYLYPPKFFSFLHTVMYGVVNHPFQLCRMLFSAFVQGSTWPQRGKLMVLGIFGIHLFRRCRVRGVQHLHVHISCGNGGLIALFAHRFGNLTFSHTVHNNLEDYSQFHEHVFREANFTIAVSAAIRKQVIVKWPWMPKDHIHVLSMGVDTEKFSPEGGSKKDREPIRLATVARLHSGKGHTDVLMALHHLNKKGLLLQYLIVGNGPCRIDLETQVCALGLNDQVKFLGAVPESQIIEILRNTDIFVLASLAEGVPVVLMEAMAMQVPVIATHVGGISELVEPEVSGLLIPPRDPFRLADAIERLIREPDLRVKMGKGGRTRILHSFESKNCADHLLSYIMTHRLFR